ncbi:MAG: ABC transporter permease [Nonomuraea sp.]|nr:ABC transporter permease [Nonomuraea sp.]
MRANFILSEVWIGLRRNLTMTIAVILTVAVGMGMLGVGLLINAQVSSMQDYWYDKIEVSVFLCSNNANQPNCKGKPASVAQTKTLETTIKAIPGVENVFYEDQAAAYKNFQEAYASNKALVQATRVEDMPTSFRVKLKDPNNYQPVIDKVQNQPGVAQVVNQKDLVGKFFDLLDKVRWFAIAIAVALVLAAALLIANTVRLSAFNRRRETGIMRLVGASNLYIQLPFVMEGMIAGLIGGVISAVLLIVTKVFLFESLATSISTTMLGWNDVARVIVYTMVIGVVLCVLASFVTLRRYLRV